MCAGAERPRRVDHDRGCIRGGVVPGRPDPEWPEPDRLVKRLPAIAPVGGDVLTAYGSEGMPQTLLAARIRISDELDPVGPIDFLETLREELEHLGPCFFDALGRDCDGDASQDAQRNALFSLSKNPSSARYVSSVESWSNCSRSLRCSSES